MLLHCMIFLNSNKCEEYHPIQCKLSIPSDTCLSRGLESPRRSLSLGWLLLCLDIIRNAIYLPWKCFYYALCSDLRCYLFSDLRYLCPDLRCFNNSDRLYWSWSTVNIVSSRIWEELLDIVKWLRGYNFLPGYKHLVYQTTLHILFINFLSRPTFAMPSNSRFVHPLQSLKPFLANPRSSSSYQRFLVGSVGSVRFTHHSQTASSVECRTIIEIFKYGWSVLLRHWMKN